MFDLIIIGGGPGGYLGAIRAAQLGMSVMVVEKDALGGTCLNRGCIPTKSFYNDAKLYKQARQSPVLSGNQDLRLSVRAMVERKRSTVAGLVKGVAGLLKAYGVAQAFGLGRLERPGAVLVQGADGITTEYQARNILLATGSRPQVLPFLEVDGRLVQTTDQALDVEEIPERIAIIGGGVIGVELAGIYANMGRSVTLFEILPDLLLTEDAEVRNLIRRMLQNASVDVHLQTKVLSVAPQEDSVELAFAGPSGQEEKQTFDRLLAATGRVPCLDGLDPARLGLAMAGPFMRADACFRTNLPGVYAVGDVIGGAMLAHKAEAEARAAVEIMAGHRNSAPDRLIPSCIWGPLEIGSVGLSEANAKSQGFDVAVGRFPYKANGAALAKGSPNGFVKIVGDKRNGEILGVHIAGDGATEMIGEAISLIGVEGVVEDFCSMIKPHPTLGESLVEAALDWNGLAVHSPPKTGTP